MPIPTTVVVTDACRLLAWSSSFPLAQLSQTTPPSVERISTTSVDSTPRGVSRRSQTIDVYGSPTIISGGFRLTYGDGDSMSTPCIPANSTALTAAAVASALSSVNAFLNVTVFEDDPPFDGARRFVVFFNKPEIGVGVLGVAEAGEDDDCEWLQCDGDGDGEDGACDESGVIVNRDVSVFVAEGAVEVCACASLHEEAYDLWLEFCSELGGYNVDQARLVVILRPGYACGCFGVDI